MITTGDKTPSFGLALDGKPANVPNGHMHVEMDTSKVYFYDEGNNTWHEDESGGGGSGLPDYSEASEGDVLSIDSNGDPAWAAPSGGGGGDSIYTVVISIIYSPDTGEMTASVTKGDFATAIQKIFAFEPIYVWVCESDFLAGLDTVGTGNIESFKNSYIELSVLNGAHSLIWDANGIEFEGP